jgi:hypothetical protein
VVLLSSSFRPARARLAAEVLDAALAARPVAFGDVDAWLHVQSDVRAVRPR